MELRADEDAANEIRAFLKPVTLMRRGTGLGHVHAAT